MNEKLKLALLQIFATKVGWMIISMILIVIFSIFSTHSSILENGYEWCDYALWFPVAYLVGLGFIMMIYAWIINPIRQYKANKKEKNK